MLTYHYLAAVDILLLIATTIIFIYLFVAHRRSSGCGSSGVSGYGPLRGRDAGGMGARGLSDTGLDEGEDQWDELIGRLRTLLDVEKIYLDPNIRISDVASKLASNKTTLSKAIKAKTNKNFCQLVHSYRVKEAMSLFAQDRGLTIADLCSKVGFNSMTTFNTAFGRNTGFTPAEWCREYLKNNTIDERGSAKKNKKSAS